MRLIVIGSLILVACRHDFPGQLRDAARDRAVDQPRDAKANGPGDLNGSDLSLRDGLSDLARTDRPGDKPKPDKPKPDKPASDKPKPDKPVPNDVKGTPDAYKPDVSKVPDASTPDKAPWPDILPTPCNFSGLTWTSGDLKLAICEASTMFGQCTASSHCGPAWHVCTPTEYAAYFPKNSTVPGEVINAWLAGCIRNGNPALDVLANNACAASGCGAKCDFGTVTIYTTCAMPSTDTSSCPYIGVKTWGACNAIGSGNSEGMWRGQETGSGLDRVACCR